MLPVRVAFEPSLPVVASQTFTVGGQAFSDGDAFPWRDHGLSEADLFSFWRSGLVRFVAEAPKPAKPTKPAQRASR